jgi:hypothetical protein
VVVSDHTPIGIPRNVTVDAGPSSRIFDTIDRKLEEVEWLPNYARNASKPIPAASAITTKKVNAPRRWTPMTLLNPLTHRQKTKSAHVPEINPEAESSPLPVSFAAWPGHEYYGDISPIDRSRVRRSPPKQRLGSRKFLLRELMDTSVALCL